MVTPDGPNYLLEFPDGHLMDLYTHWHPLRCKYAFLDTEIFVLSRGKRNCHRKCDIISEREIIDMKRLIQNVLQVLVFTIFYLFIYLLYPHFLKKVRVYCCYPFLSVRPSVLPKESLSLELRLHFKDLRNDTLGSR